MMIISLSDAAEMIRNWSYNYENEHNCNDVGSDYISSSEVDQERLMHFAFSLLRKADPTTLLFTKLDVEERHSDYPEGECNWALVFKLAEDEKKEIEFHVRVREIFQRRATVPLSDIDLIF